MKRLNCVGDVCPIPVVKAKKALEKMEAGQLEIRVDNQVAVENLNRMVDSIGAILLSQKEEDSEYILVIEKHLARTAGVDAHNDKVKGMANDKVKGMANDKVGIGCNEKADVDREDSGDLNDDWVVVISSDKMGDGDDQLGQILLKGFIFSLTQMDRHPEKVICYNRGIMMSLVDSPSFENMKMLEDRGVEILCCGTCLDFFGVKEKLGAGKIVNMYDIAACLQDASKVVRP